jgi:hypothetical protein
MEARGGTLGEASQRMVVIITSTLWRWCGALAYSQPTMKYMERSLILCLLLCSGCTALESRGSQAWLALHAVDTVQTFRIADHPTCFEEGDSITQSLIGRHPSYGEVAAWSVGSAALHLGVTEWLLRTDHPRIAKAWQYLRIGITAAAVSDNHSVGIRIGSPNQPRTCDPLPALPTFDEGARPIK